MAVERYQWEDRAMEAADVWKILLGAVVALAGTLLAQWSSLAYQTRRQREARRADFQRTTLLQLRDALGELDDAVLAYLRARYEALQRHGGWDKLDRLDPAWEGIRRANSQLLVISTAIDDRGLRVQATALAYDVLQITKASTDSEAEQHREQLSSLKGKVTLALGEQLRRLP